jgi:anaerobic selenocysteine-containing dehydrogenase
MSPPPVKKKSYCRLCTAYCGIEVELRDGRAHKIVGDTSDPISGGYTCMKGRQLPHQLHGPQRLHSSLKRQPDGTFAAIATEQALDEIADKIRELMHAYGPRAIASFSGTAAYANSGTMAVVRAWHRGIGSSSNYSTLTIDQPAKIVATAHHGVWAGGGHTFASSDVTLALGINPIVSGLSMPGGVPGTNPVAALNEARKRGHKLICIDPRRSELARRADIHLQVRPGEDACLLAGMLRLILEEELHDREFCRDNTQGLDALRAGLANFTPAYVEQRSGVPAQQMMAAARLFAKGPRGYTSSGTGADMSPHPRLTGHLLACLNTACGRHNREGDPLPNPGVLSLPVPRPAQAIPKELLPPILNCLNGPEARFRELRGSFGEMPSATLADEIVSAGDGQIRALISVGANPLLAMPDPLAMGKALDSLELSVAVDVCLSTSARRCDYVIAAKHTLEREDVSEFMDPFYEVPFAHYTHAVVEPGPETVEDWEVFIGLARRLGSAIQLPGGSVDVEHPPSKLALLKLIFPATRIPLERLRDTDGGKVYDELDVTVSPALPGIDAKLDFAPSGTVEALHALSAESPDAGDDPRFSHRLIVRRLNHVINSIGRDFPDSMARGTSNPAFINRDDLAALGLAAGDLVEIESEHGSILAVAEPTDALQPGAISMAHCFGDDLLSPEGVRTRGSNTGLLVATDRAYDRITGMPRLSAIPVALRVARSH